MQKQIFEKCFFLVLFILPQVYFAQKEDAGKDEIIKVLEYFQEGYTNRDTSIIDQYVKNLFTEDILIVGTGASEWPSGIEACKNLVKWDWKYWGDVKIDIEKAIIRIEDNIAWIATTGTLSRNFDSKEFIYERYGVNDIKRISEKDQSNKMKLLELIDDASELLYEVEQAGTEFVYPLRIVASLVEKNGEWKFKQMGFSYPFPRKLIIKE